MIPGVGDFGAFFAAMNGGLRPFAWQSRLLRGLLEEGRWPDRIAAPTGSGKSAVIDVHVFAVALMAAGVGPRIPRRLSIVVDRRAIVDSHVDRAERVNARLRDAASRGDGVVGAVAHALLGLYVGDADERDPVVVSVVRGGALPDTKWRDEPTACAVICATPDMWGSRLLLRGYGTSRLARPREAGLLAYDAVVVVDEAHLNRQALRTGRRIADLESMAARRVGPPVLQVVEMTATPHLTETDDGASGPEGVVSVEPDDLASDPDLAVRVERPKPVSIVPIPDWPPRTTKSVGTLALVVADEAERLRSEHGQTVGCVLNTVAAAVSVAEILRARGLEIEVLVGRMRPWDIIALRERRPHLLTPKGDPGVDVLVATQTIEVGVDADFSALVTELASGSALAQRAGRVNRLGRRTAGPVVVVGPPDDGMRLRDAPPYISADLEAGLAWLVGRTADPGGLAPWALRSDPPPPQTLHRTLLARPEPSDAWFLARTTDGLFAEPDLDLWLADDLDVDHDIGLVVRQGLPEDVAVAVSLLRATPPRPKEVFPVRIRLATTVLDAHADEPAYLFREGDVTPLGPGAGLRPGDLIVVDDGRRCFRERVVDEGGTGAADDVLEIPIDDAEPLVVRFAKGAPEDPGGGAIEALLDEIAKVIEEQPLDGRERRKAFARRIEDHIRLREGRPAERVRSVVSRLQRGRIADVEVIIGPTDSSATPAWLVVADTRRWVGDEELHQTWVLQARRVALSHHQAAVAERAADIGAGVALDAALIGWLRTSGHLHDEGKRDPRFQASLRGEVETPGDEPLAKSGMRRPADAREARARSGLPTGWRHEQLSAATAWARLEDRPIDERSFVARLVGTSHGFGRVGFPHDSSGLLGDGEMALPAARDLFDDGAWDALVERTEAEWGVWGCVYLEGILRAADGQVSGEGR